MLAMNPEDVTQSYFRYWGKTTDAQVGSPRYHLLVFHSLDVAACGWELLDLPRFGVRKMAEELGWTGEALKRVFVALLAVHDVGKFSRAFQGLVPDLGEALVPPSQTRYQRRHDTMGWALLEDSFFGDLFPGLPKDHVPHAFWQSWFRLIAGHHGRPPQQEAPETKHMFLPEDLQAAQAFLQNVFAMLHPGDLPTARKEDRATILRLSWRLAGLAVLADWIGSNADWFRPQERPKALSSYWEGTALPRAREAVEAAGLGQSRVRAWSTPEDLFAFSEFTPLQRYAASVPLSDKPQLFLLEDVTGSGKTEAALLLAHRLMAAGHAAGLYFGLPTMATANQLYARVGDVYGKLYQPGEQPSLVLSHGANKLVEPFRKSILEDGRRPPERGLGGRQGEPPNASEQCSAWLADNRKKAMLAEVGVGTIDQALLGVLPVPHQSLRLLGLAHKVLVVDEVHAYDAYTSGLLETLVQAQAMAGGSTILLSATVPSILRRKLIHAYWRGLDVPSLCRVEPDLRYPLATQVKAGAPLLTEAFATRPELVRRVRVKAYHAEAEALVWVARMAEVGRAVCWIRNTVEDARRAYDSLLTVLPSSQVMLFHARFAMGDRLGIEEAVLERFGKDSGSQMRRGRVLVATQVVEQSLDLDFDEMLSDLAPMDLLIQRAGRLHRHLRSVDGDPSPQAQADGRGDAVLHLLAPERTAEPKESWYASLFPKAQYVYIDIGKLWLTLEALLDAGQIVSPGAIGERGSVRSLIEAVYGEEADVPPGLQAASLKAEGKRRSDSSLGHFNALKLELGYGEDSSEHWREKTDTPTRLGDETEPVYLTREEDGALVPFLAGDRFPWEMSAVSLRMGVVDGLAPEWQARFGPMIDVLRKNVRLLSDPETFVLPLVPDGEGWHAKSTGKGKPVTVRYTKQSGFQTEQAGEP